VDQVDDDACVGLLALIAGIVSYLHMHILVALHGQPGWVAVLTPLSVDGMIVAASSKRAGTAGEFSVGNAPDDRCGDKEEVLAVAAT
jgi:hypothetical protein